MVYKKYARWLLVFVWMGLIFYLSHQPSEQSSELSSGVTEVLLKMLAFILPAFEEIPIIHFLIRKAAHFFAYFMLGIFVFHALKKSVKSIWRRCGFTMLISLVYAISDEVHQLFIPGRSGEVGDVMIDSLGAAVGLGVYLLFMRKPK